MGFRVKCPFHQVPNLPFNGGFCDNLRHGIPVCVATGFFAVSGWWDDEYEEACMTMDDDEIEKKFPEQVKIAAIWAERCRRIILSDIGLRESDCSFGGGICVRGKVHCLDDCDKDCAVWKNVCK